MALVRPPIWALFRSNALLRYGASGPTQRRERKTTRYADHTTPSVTKRYRGRRDRAAAPAAVGAAATGGSMPRFYRVGGPAGGHSSCDRGAAVARPAGDKTSTGAVRRTGATHPPLAVTLDSAIPM